MSDIAPPARAIDIGDGHKIVYAEYQGETAGITEWHRKSDGNWCCGWAPFNGCAWVRSFNGNVQGWDVVQRDPLTISPSLQCRICGNHGHIRNGRWEPA